jgi:antitoxin HicB
MTGSFSQNLVKTMAKTKKSTPPPEVPATLYRVPLLFRPQPEGGYTVTSPALPELVTEGDTLAEAFANARDALAAVVELYADEGRPLPSGVILPEAGEVIWSDALVEAT